MKFFKILSILLLTASLFSCSSDNSNDTSAEPMTNFFNLTYNDVDKTVNLSEVTAIRQENQIEVYAEATDGTSVSFNFNTYGNLYNASVNTGSNYKSSFAYFSTTTFFFELVYVDSTKKTVTVNFSGKVYENEYDHTSASSIVRGSFKIPYIDHTPTISGMGTFAKINGTNWHAISKGSTNDGTRSIVTVQNGTAYVIGIVYPYNNPNTGTFYFSDNSALNRISFSKYDPATHTLTEYDVTGGVITFTTASSIIEGTFSLSASHPTNSTSATIYITNGTFKEAAM